MSSLLDSIAARCSREGRDYFKDNKATQAIKLYKKGLESLTPREKNGVVEMNLYANLSQAHVKLGDFEQAEIVAKEGLAKFPWFPKMYWQLLEVYKKTTNSIAQVTVLWRACHYLAQNSRLDSNDQQLTVITRSISRELFYASEEMYFLNIFSSQASFSPFTRGRLMASMEAFKTDKENIQHKDTLILLGEKLYAGNKDVTEELLLFLKFETFALAFLHLFPNVFKDVFYRGLKKLNDLNEARLIANDFDVKYLRLLHALHVLTVNMNPFEEHFFKVQNHLDLVRELFRTTVYEPQHRLAVVRILAYLCFEPSNVFHLFKNFDMTAFFDASLVEVLAASGNDMYRYSRELARFVLIVYKHADYSFDLYDAIGHEMFYKVCNLLLDFPDEEDDDIWLNMQHWLTFWEVIAYRYPKSCILLWESEELKDAIKIRLREKHTQYARLVEVFAKSDSKLRETIASDQEIKSLLSVAFPNDEHLWTKMLKNLLYGEEFVLSTTGERTASEREFDNLQYLIAAQLPKLYCDSRALFMRLDSLYFFVSKKKITTVWMERAMRECFWLDCILFALQDFVIKKHDISASYPVYLKTTLLLLRLFLRDHRLRDVYLEEKHQVLLKFQTIVVQLYRMFCVTPNHVISELLLDVLVLM